MKTSNKLLLFALIIFVLSLGIYNCALKAEFLTGNYKKRSSSFTTLNFKNFDEIEVNAANQMDVAIEKGSSKVLDFKNLSAQVKITQEGNRLILDVADTTQQNFGTGSNNVVIYCPNLKKITARGGSATESKIIVENQVIIDNNNHHAVTIHGFTEDSLLLKQDNGSVIKLIDNRINLLKAVMGITANASPFLDIQTGNTIPKADLQIEQKSRLHIGNVYIPQLKYHFSDSSAIDLQGMAAKSLNN